MFNYRKQWWYGWLCALLLSLTAAAGQAAGLPADAYQPLPAQGCWVYQGEGQEFAGFTRQVLYQSGNRLQVVDDNGGARVVRVFQADAAAVVELRRVAETNVWENWLEQPLGEPLILLQAPLRPGHSWSDARQRRTIISVDETLQVPGGRFYSVVKVLVEPRTGGSFTYEYYAPHVGLVKREYHSPQGDTVQAGLSWFGYGQPQPGGMAWHCRR